MNSDSLAAELVAAREQGGRCNSLPDIKTVDEAYALQAAVNACEGQAPIGFKIGATLDAAMEMLNLDTPFHGEIFKAYHRDQGERIAVFDSQPTSVETEFVVGLGRDIKRGTAEISVDDAVSYTHLTLPTICSV